MDFLASIFGKALGFIYGIIPNYGLSIIIFTVITRALLLPISFKQIKSTRVMSELQPKVQEIQKKYASNKEVMNQKTLELYKENNYNPLAGCLPMILQMILLIGLYTALRLPEKFVFETAEATKIATHQFFLWIPNLSQPDFLSNVLPNFEWAKNLPGLMPILSSAFTFLSIQLSPTPAMPQNQDGSAQPGGGAMKVMKYFMPALILFYGTKLSGGLILYWTVGNLFAIGQQLLFNNLFNRKITNMEV